MLQLNWLAVVCWCIFFLSVYLLLFFSQSRCFSRFFYEYLFSYFLATNFRDGQKRYRVSSRDFFEEIFTADCKSNGKIDNVNRRHLKNCSESMKNLFEKRKGKAISAFTRKPWEFFHPGKLHWPEALFMCKFLPYAHFHCRLSWKIVGFEGYKS